MKIYLLYLLPKNKLYAISDNKKLVKRFISERNPKLFNVIIKTGDKEDIDIILNEYKLLKLNTIPLEDSNGDYEIIGTLEEDNLLSYVCERMSETCHQLKLHFNQNVPFKNEYKYLLDNLTTIEKNIDNHPIIQIDSVKLFYYLFKDSFINNDDIDYMDASNDRTSDVLEKFKSYY